MGEEIESKKSIILLLPLKERKGTTFAKVEEMICTEDKIIVDAKPLVVQCVFEGDVLRINVRDNPKEFAEMLKKFESSKHEVLVIAGKGRTYVYSKKEFERILESNLEKIVTQKYLEGLHKALKEGYVV